VHDEDLKFQKGSIKMLFMQGGKCLHDFAANLFMKVCTKIYENCLSFTEDI